MAAFQASPEVYAQRSYLQTLARHGSEAGKIAVLFWLQGKRTVLLFAQDYFDHFASGF